MIYPFSTYLYKDEGEVVLELLDFLRWDDAISSSVSAQAIDLVVKTRSTKKRGGQLESFLQEFSLNTDEGLAMMCLAEALLRIPDARTANALIKDKVVAANWLQKQGVGSKDWMAKAAGLGMALTRKTLDSAFSKLGEPLIREAMTRAMQMMGKQFVLGTSIDDAIKQAKKLEMQGYRMSYDMLGEGARDAKTAEDYFSSYKNAIANISENNNRNITSNAGISVKLSALHPRYIYSQKARCIPEITAKLKALCMLAAQANIPLTVDAEEANRLDLSIQIIENIIKDDDLKDWAGFGLAVQAYQKRALPLINYISNYTRTRGRSIQIRLVKGAYWDSEIKHAQMGGYKDYPVFTRKVNTDLSYLACAQAMLTHADVIYPMFATHNAHSICAIRHMAKSSDVAFEFQRLHGMGEGLMEQIIDEDDVRCSVYAPVGPHKDLLPYLVRRLLENGANSSFVNQLLDHQKVPAKIITDPVLSVRIADHHRHRKIPLPKDLFGQNRLNSKGIDLDNQGDAMALVEYVQDYDFLRPAVSYVNGKVYNDVSEGHIGAAFASARSGFHRWNAKDIEERAVIIERCADMLEKKMDEFIAV